MKKLSILMTALLLGGCNATTPPHNPDNTFTLHVVMVEDDYPAKMGWCDQPKPKTGPAIYYEWQNGKCVPKVRGKTQWRELKSSTLSPEAAGATDAKPIIGHRPKPYANTVGN